MLGKELLKNAGMSAYERKCVYEDIKEIAWEKQDDHYYFVETIISTNHEITFSYDHESVGDDYCDYDALDFVEILGVVKYDYEKLLKNAGIDYQTSNGSPSIYFELDGKTYRISNHKRPAYQDESENWHEWNDEDIEIICENEIEMYHEIKAIIEEQIY